MPNPFGLALATAETQMGIALEATRGTASPAKYFIPIRAPKYKPDRMYLPDQSLQGSMVQTYNMVPAMRYDSHGWDGYVYMDHFPVMVACQLGSPDTLTVAPAPSTFVQPCAPGNNTIQTSTSIPIGSFINFGTQANGDLEAHMTTGLTGASSPYTVTLSTKTLFQRAAGDPITGLTKHVFSLLNNVGQGNQPPSATLYDYDGDQWRCLTAGQQGDLTIKGNATALLEYTSTWFCNPSTTPTSPTVSYATNKPAPSYTSSLVMGGNQVVAVEDFTIDLKRGTKPIPALTGTQEYFEYFAGPIQATGHKFTCIDTLGAPEITSFLNGKQFAFDLLCFDNFSGQAMDIHCSQAIYVAADLARSKEYVEEDMTMDFLPSAADATAGGVSPVIISFGNTVTTPYL